jgi:hypothetical protein
MVVDVDNESVLRPWFVPWGDDKPLSLAKLRFKCIGEADR